MPDTPAIIFDVGNVLLDWQPERIYREAIPDAGERAWFMANVVPLSWHEQQDRGRSCTDGIAEQVGRFPEYESLIARFYDHWLDTIEGPISGTVDILRDLKAQGYKIHALTNFSAELWPITIAAHPFLAEIDVAVVSGAEGVVKPDPRIFEVLLARTGQLPGDCIFIDDRIDNVEAARALGFRSVRFTTPEALRMDLIKLGIRLPIELAG